MPKICKYILFTLLLILPTRSAIWAQTKTLDRDYEPVVITGINLSDFLGVSTSRLFAYQYTSAIDSWMQIPFQLDDVGSDESYFSESDGILDSDDELVFMAKDMGDKAPSTSWISDADSRNYTRIEILVTDGTDPSKRAWAYVYRSATLSVTPGTDYVNVNITTDRITGDNYELDHNAAGILDEIAITTAGGGNNTDIIDREKVRLRGSVLIASYDLTEDNLNIQNIQYKDGIVRVLREASYSLNIPVNGENFTKAVSERYYDRMAVTGGSIGYIDPAWGTNYIRQSLDFNAAASGMTFSNNNNTSLTVDGVPDVANTNLPAPGVGWAMASGPTQGSIVQIVNLPVLGNPQMLYYYDDATSGSSGDTTPETGDGFSYGDAGVSFSNPSTGIFSLGFVRFFLPANEPVVTGQMLAGYVASPMVESYESQQAATANSLYARISNPRIDGPDFKWDVEINRPDDWGAGADAVLGDCIFYFNVNPAGVTPDNPVVTVTNANIAGNSNYSFASGRTGGNTECYMHMIHNSAGGGTDYYPPLNTWVPIFTAGIPIALATETSGLTWLAPSTSFEKGSGTVLTPTLIGSGDIGLPVELTSLSASAENGMVILRWTTESETENLGFYIFRCDNADGPYVRITLEVIAGSGNSASRKYYQYQDADVQNGTSYYYKLADMDLAGNLTFHGPVRATAAAPMPEHYRLEQNYPNPFNAETRIFFTLSEAGNVYVIVYNSMGQHIRELVNKYMQQGRHAVDWDGTDDQGHIVPSGTYFYVLQVNGFSQTRRMTLLK